ncbi:efflux RND transporter periplasmic adaptor subunit [Candidatus Latescibacterota bacterium]
MRYLLRACNLFFAVVLVFFLFSCDTEQKVQDEIIRPVRSEQVFSGGSRSRTFSGVAKAGIESNLSFKVPGNVEKLLIKVGNTVKAGDLIAELDDIDYNLEVKRSEASLEQTEARLRNAKAMYDRIRLLWENNNTSRSDLDNAQTSFETAKAMVDAGKRTCELAQLQLGYTKLTAPVDGAIASVNVEENENVYAGQTVALLSSGSRIEVDVSIPEKLIYQVKEGSSVLVTFDAVENEEFTGIITEVGITISGDSPAYPVTIKLDQDTDKVRAGMAAEVTISFESENDRNAIIVPSRAIGEDSDGRFVYIAIPSGDGLAQISKRNITVGELTSEGIEVLEGLKDGDRVVTAGLSKISDDMTVKLLGN